MCHLGGMKTCRIPLHVDGLLTKLCPIGKCFSGAQLFSLAESQVKYQVKGCQCVMCVHVENSLLSRDSGKKDNKHSQFYMCAFFIAKFLYVFSWQVIFWDVYQLFVLGILPSVHQLSILLILSEVVKLYYFPGMQS